MGVVQALPCTALAARPTPRPQVPGRVPASASTEDQASVLEGGPGVPAGLGDRQAAEFQSRCRGRRGVQSDAAAQRPGTPAGTARTPAPPPSSPPAPAPAPGSPSLPSSPVPRAPCLAGAPGHGRPAAPVLGRAQQPCAAVPGCRTVQPPLPCRRKALPGGSIPPAAAAALLRRPTGAAAGRWRSGVLSGQCTTSASARSWLTPGCRCSYLPTLTRAGKSCPDNGSLWAWVPRACSYSWSDCADLW